MNKVFSLYLDLIRALAALVVVFYHYSNQVANGEWAHSFPKIGQEAVILFFVFSGYVITYDAGSIRLRNGELAV
jgi:peptidoglycan/LPS O-acetylase OafA/YrhL